MKLLNKLTIRNLALNKKRAFVTIIGTILATFLICVVAGLASTFIKTEQNDALITYGNWHVAFDYVKKEQASTIMNYRGVKDSFFITEVGYVKALDEWQSEYWGSYYSNKNPEYLHILALNNKTISHLPIKLIKGRMPKNNHEIVITSDLNEGWDSYYKIGDKVTFKVGNLVDEKGNNVLANFYDDQDETVHLEKENSQEYTIVGIIDDSFYAAQFYFYCAFTYEEEMLNYSNIYVIYDNPREYEGLTSSIISNIVDNGNYVNSVYLATLGANFSNNFNLAIYGIALIVIGVIMITSILVIRNGFSISITERYKQFGLLSSIGITPHQIRKMVLYEALIIGLISIPIGIILGYVSVYLLVKLIYIFTKTLELKIIVDIPMSAISLAVITSALTILLSALIPAYKVSKIPIVEAIRSNDSIKIKGKKLRTPKYIKSLFGIGGVISYKNLKRSRKKYRTTVISIVVSITIFIALYSVMNVGFKASNYYLSNYEYDLEIYYNPNRSYKTFNEVLSDQEKMEKIIKKMGNYEHIAFENGLTLVSFNPKDWHPDYINTRSYHELKYGDIHLYTLGDEEYKRYVESLGGKVEDYKDGAIILDKAYLKKNNKYYEIDLLNAKVGDILNLSIEHRPSEGRVPDDFNWEGTNIPIKIVNKTDKKPMSIHDEMNTIEKEYDITSVIAVISDELYEELIRKYGKEIVMNDGLSHNDIDYRKFSNFTTYIKTSDREAIKEKIDEFNDTREILSYYDKNDSYEETRSLIILVAIFLYGFITIISLIGITNIFNVITTNMALRKREFAMLKAIGMTDKEFNKMIRLESLLYGFKSLIIGIPLGCFLSYLVHLMMMKILITPYVLPVKSIVLSIIFVFIVIYVTMHYSLKQIKKQNIMDTIRNDNI